MMYPQHGEIGDSHQSPETLPRGAEQDEAGGKSSCSTHWPDVLSVMQPLVVWSYRFIAPVLFRWPKKTSNTIRPN